MEDISTRQQKEAEEDRIDYERVDNELINDARNKRKRTRANYDPKTRKVADDVEEDDDDFRMNLDKADKKFKVRRKKKHLFNDAGIKIEPFSMGNDLVEKHGNILLMNENNKDSDEEDDPWYASIRQQQEELLKEKAREQIDSEESESSEDNLKSQGDEDNMEPPPVSVKIDVNEVISLKKKL